MHCVYACVHSYTQVAITSQIHTYTQRSAWKATQSSVDVSMLSNKS